LEVQPRNGKIIGSEQCLKNVDSEKLGLILVVMLRHAQSTGIESACLAVLQPLTNVKKLASLFVGWICATIASI
jgi:hypothetical protein